MKFLVRSKPIPCLDMPEDPAAFFHESTEYLDALPSHSHDYSRLETMFSTF